MAGIAVKIGPLPEGRYGSDGIRHGRDQAPGGRAAAGARVAGELLGGSQGPLSLRDAQGYRTGVHTRRRVGPRRAASLLPDTRDLPLHPVLRSDPRRLLQLEPAVRHGALRLLEAAPAGAGLRPDPGLHREHFAQLQTRLLAYCPSAFSARSGPPRGPSPPSSTPSTAPTTCRRRGPSGRSGASPS